jgi:UDPglucose 6-dehydrogenase
MKVGIIGYGFVGSALKNGIKSDVDVCIVDPKLGTCEKDLLAFSPEIIFICAPTPMRDNGTQDLTIVNGIIHNLNELQIKCTIVIKSTVLPDNLNKIKDLIPNIIYNPEFLREKHADIDFIKSNLIVIGGNSKEARKIEVFYKNNTKCMCTDYVKTDLITASLIKYTINSFLATKVSFFNELKVIFDKLKTEDSWENFIRYLAKDTRLGNSHMSVPGHDGKLGFGGACLPKDSLALLKFAEENRSELRVLHNAIDINNNIRSMYEVDNRELSQNINFSDND